MRGGSPRARSPTTTVIPGVAPERREDPEPSRSNLDTVHGRWVHDSGPLGSSNQGSERSRHCGLAASIKASFQARRQPLICFSRAIASRIVGWFSNQTSVLQP